MKLVYLLIAAVTFFAFTGLVMAWDVAISTQAGWWGQAAADKEMADLATKIKGTPTNVTLFAADKQADLATWVEQHQRW